MDKEQLPEGCTQCDSELERVDHQHHVVCHLQNCDHVAHTCCDRCHAVWYCSIQCKITDWENHLSTCKGTRGIRLNPANARHHYPVAGDGLIFLLEQPRRAFSNAMKYLAVREHPDSQVFLVNSNIRDLIETIMEYEAEKRYGAIMYPPPEDIAIFYCTRCPPTQDPVQLYTLQHLRDHVGIDPESREFLSHCEGPSLGRKP